MDRSRFITSLTPLLPRRHSLGPPHLPGSGSFAIYRYSPWIMLHPEVWHFLLPHAFPWIPVLSAYIPILLHTRGEFGGFFIIFLGGRGVGRYSYYTTIAFLFRRQHTARRYGTITASVLSIYQFECGGSGCVRVWLCPEVVACLCVCAWLDRADSVAIYLIFASSARFSLSLSLSY